MLPDDPDAQARLFYLSILGLAVASSLLWRYQGRIGVAVQHLAIWALIFVGLIIGYGFKDQLIGQLVPSTPVAAGDATVVLARGRDGHFHADLTINGADVRFLIDTGATGMVLSDRNARRVGLDPDRLMYTAPAMTANGRVMTASVRLDTVRLGPFLDSNVRATVTDGGLEQSLLGMSYLRHFGSLRIEDTKLFLSRQQD